MPQFSCVEKIVTVPGKDSAPVFLVLKEIVAMNYESHLHAYRVRILNEGAITVRSQAELTPFRPLHICTVVGDNDSKYICPKSDVNGYNEQV